MNKFMISDEMLALLACPESHQPLRRAPAALVALLNAEIARKSLRDAAGRLVQAPMDAGLVRDDGQRLYPVLGGLPVLRAESAILLSESERALALA